jgi:spermidine synthase
MVYLLFLLSGASGLLLETLWTYQATLALGSGYWAVTAVLSAFMTGLAIGNLLALRRSVWSLRTYALLEGVILITGLVALVLLPAIGRLMAPAFGAMSGHPAVLNVARFVIALVVLAVPSTAMGMTLPALAQALGGEQGSFRTVLGRLYGLNTLGAIGGVLGAEVLLLPAAGVFGTGAVAALLNGAAAIGAWTISRRVSAAPAEPAWDRKIPKTLLPALATVCLAGFALLALEVVWTRFLALFVPNSSLAFALMLATVLAGIALGGLAGGATWIRPPYAFLVLFAAGGAVLVSYASFPLFHPAPGTLLKSTGQILLAGIVLQFPVSFLSGTFFTLAGTEVRDRIASSQATAGLLVLFNTFGAAAGAVVAGFLLVPRLGVERAFLLVALIYGIAGFLWCRSTGGERRWLAVGAAAWAASILLFPFGQFEKTHVPAAAKRWVVNADTRIETVREGLTETTIYLQAREFDRVYCSRMLTNSMSMSANSVSCDRYMKQFVYWPVAVHPAPRRALLICFGVGSTASALTRTRELETIDMVDLSRDVLELSDIVFPDPAGHPLKDPRVRVHVEDGRFFLQTRSETWDLITGEPPPPEMPGVAGLYSREYFQLLKNRLSEGGIATYWLPIHDLSEAASLSILKAWAEVFDTCFLWRGANQDLMVMGFRGRPTRVSAERFRAQWENPATRADLIDVGLDVPETLGTGFIGDGDYLRALCAGASPTLDAWPKRIVAPGAEEKMIYPGWFDVDACADRFRKSASLGEIWPSEVKERTSAFFKWEANLTTPGNLLRRTRFPDFSEIHAILTTTPLRSAAIWALGSDRDYIRAAGQAEPPPASAEFHRGVRALAERDFGRAADHLLRTVGAPRMTRVELATCLYALCRAGRRAEADKVLAGVWDERKMKAIPGEYWAWMRSTFGLQVP